MSGVNRVILIGNVGKDPEQKSLPGGGAVVNIALATSESWKDKNTGQPQEKTEWHNIQLWGNSAELAGQYLQKGREVFIEGRISTQTWEKDGEKKYKTVIEANSFQFVGNNPGSASPQTTPASFDAPADDLPF